MRNIYIILFVLSPLFLVSCSEPESDWSQSGAGQWWDEQRQQRSEDYNKKQQQDSEEEIKKFQEFIERESQQKEKERLKFIHEFFAERHKKFFESFNKESKTEEELKAYFFKNYKYNVDDIDWNEGFYNFKHNSQNVERDKQNRSGASDFEETKEKENPAQAQAREDAERAQHQRDQARASAASPTKPGEFGSYKKELNLSDTASRMDIKRALQTTLRMFHQDRCGGGQHCLDQYMYWKQIHEQFNKGP